MHGDNAPFLENTHLIGCAVHFHGTPARSVGHAVEIAADRDHAVAADAPLQPQHGLKRPSREWLELGTFFGKMLGHDSPCRGMDAHVGDLVEPLTELPVEVLEVMEAAAEEEVLTDVTEWALDL